MAHGDFKDLPKRTVSDKVTCDKEYNIAKSPKYDGYQRRVMQWFINVLIKKSSYGAVSRPNKSAFESEIIPNQLLENSKNEKIRIFKYNIWGADLADLQLISKCNYTFCFYYVLLIFIVNMHWLFV